MDSNGGLDYVSYPLVSTASYNDICANEKGKSQQFSISFSKVKVFLFHYFVTTCRISELLNHHNVDVSSDDLVKHRFHRERVKVNSILFFK